MHGTRTRLAIIALLVGASAAGAWLAGPLFLVTRANAPVPAGFETVVKEGTWAGRGDFHFASGSAKILTGGPRMRPGGRLQGRFFAVRRAASRYSSDQRSWTACWDSRRNRFR